MTIPLEDLAHEARTLDLAAFCRRHAPFFFVSLGHDLRKTRVPMATARWEPGAANSAVLQRHTLAAQATRATVTSPSFALHSVAVFPIKRLATSQFPFVSIGRLDGNDIALGDPTVSKFHAYLKADESGAFVLLQDGRSQNGTFVDGLGVAQRHVGPPTLLTSGQNVRFGSVSLAYLDAQAVMRLAQNAVAASAPAFA